jgi:arylamine N-acetyltransferase
MDAEQFAKYLELVDHPAQLELMPDVVSLYIIYREHVTRFPYQNLHLYLGKPLPDLSVSSLLETLPLEGGHCFQQSEMMFAVLKYVGFQLGPDGEPVPGGHASQPQYPPGQDRGGYLSV